MVILVTELVLHPQSSVVDPQVQFRPLFDAHFPYVWRTLRRLGVQERDLADVSHEVFITVFRRWDDYDPLRSIKPWLFGIAQRVASDYRRLARHRREVPANNEIEQADVQPLPDERLAIRERQKVVRDALATLDDDRRAVFVLHEIDEVAISEIAEALGIPLNTAYSRLRLARADFRAAVVRQGGKR